MIEARDLTKFYGRKAAVDHLSFTVEPGRVTGFLGPNGAAKSTTMRLIAGPGGVRLPARTPRRLNLAEQPIRVVHRPAADQRQRGLL